MREKTVQVFLGALGWRGDGIQSTAMCQCCARETASEVGNDEAGGGDGGRAVKAARGKGQREQRREE